MLLRGFDYKALIFGLLFFLSIYFPYIGLFPTLLIAHVGMALVFLCRAKISVGDAWLCAFSVVFFVYATLLSIWKSTVDIRLIEFSLYLPVLYFAAKYLAVLSSMVSHCKVWKWVVLSFVIQSLTIISLNVGFLSPDLFYSIVRVDPKVLSYPITRYPGFAYDAFSYSSVLQAFGCCLIINLIQKKFTVYLFICLIIVFVSVVFSGRAGILVVVTYMGYRILAPSITYLAFLGATFVFIMLVWALDWQYFEWYKGWAFSFIAGFLTGNTVSDTSVSELNNHFFMPDNIFFGDALSFLEVASDMGFTRMLNASGLIGVTLASALFFALGLMSLMKRHFTVFFIVAILVLLNFKDVYFVAPYGHFFLLFFLLHRANEIGCRVEKRTGIGF